jgi:uncharacterized protein YqeY
LWGKHDFVHKFYANHTKSIEIRKFFVFLRFKLRFKYSSQKIMNLLEKINAEIMTAMRAKDAVRLRGLRAIKSAILIANTDGSGKELDTEREIALLQKLVKQRRDSLEIFTAQGRADLAVVEEEELATITEFLPQQMTEAELAAAVGEIITQTGATSAKDMGKVMGAATKTLAGKTEGKLISEMVKKLLAQM